jgi:hypothetical protein
MPQMGTNISIELSGIGENLETDCLPENYL